MKFKKVLTVGLVAGLVAGSLALPAEAKKKKKKKPQPVETTMYLHGASQLGEIDGVQWFADGAGARSLLTLDGNEPTDASPKSMNFFNPALNDQCTGLPLGFPTFTGDLSGTITGDATLTLHFASAPASGVIARIWADIGAFSACNDAYIAPASEVVFDVPGGQSEVEVVFEGLDLTAMGSIMVEVLVPSGTDYSGQVGRLLYDSTSAPGSLVFDCIPASGSSCI